MLVEGLGRRVADVRDMCARHRSAVDGVPGTALDDPGRGVDTVNGMVTVEVLLIGWLAVMIVILAGLSDPEG